MQTPGNALFFHAIIFLSYALSFWHAHACTGRTFDQASFAWNPVHEEPFRAKEWISQILRAHRRYGRIHRSHKERIKSYFRRCGKKPVSLKDMLKEIGESSSKVFSTAPCYKNIRCCRLLALARGNITELLCRRIDPQELAKMSFSSCHRCTSGHEKP